MRPAIERAIAERVAAIDWRAVGAALDRGGHAVIARLLDAEACAALAALYADDEPFRSRIVMRRHGFGDGEYKYFRYPLPPVVAALRRSVYPHLAPIANLWAERLPPLAQEGPERFPPALDAYLARCHAAGQTRPTPLLLRYGPGDYNCLHQDLYGALSFPLQMTVLLSAPGGDFSGGEFLLVEQRPRAQSKGEVVPLGQGDAVVFAVNHRPVTGKRGFYRVKMRHGVSPLRAGRRMTLGVIFHDAA